MCFSQRKNKTTNNKPEELFKNVRIYISSDLYVNISFRWLAGLAFSVFFLFFSSPQSFMRHYSKKHTESPVWTVRDQEGNSVQEKPFWNCVDGSFTYRSRLSQGCENDYTVHLFQNINYSVSIDAISQPR